MIKEVTFPSIFDEMNNPDFRNVNQEEWDTLLFSDIANDSEFIVETLEAIILSRHLMVLSIDNLQIKIKYIENNNDFTDIFIDECITNDCLIYSYDGDIFGLNCPSDQFSAFFVKAKNIDREICRSTIDRFIASIKSGRIGFSDAAFDYFRCLLGPLGIAVD